MRQAEFRSSDVSIGRDEETRKILARRPARLALATWYARGSTNFLAHLTGGHAVSFRFLGRRGPPKTLIRLACALGQTLAARFAVRSCIAGVETTLETASGSLRLCAQPEWRERKQSGRDTYDCDGKNCFHAFLRDVLSPS